MPRTQMTDEAFRQRAEEEGNNILSVGGLYAAFDETRVAPSAARAQQQGHLPTGTFSTLVNLQRRALHLSLEELADKARVELEEVVSIEDNASYTPEPRTVCNLAGVLRLPERQLLVISGNATARSTQLTDAALRFAARSKAVEKLNRDEKEALDEFVKVLVEQAEDQRGR